MQRCCILLKVILVRNIRLKLEADHVQTWRGGAAESPIVTATLTAHVLNNLS